MKTKRTTTTTVNDGIILGTGIFIAFCFWGFIAAITLTTLGLGGLIAL